MSSLGPRLPLSSSGGRPPASLPQEGDGPVGSLPALLWYLLSPLFCERAQQCLRLRLFLGKFSLSLSFLSLSLAIPQFGLLSHVSSLRLSSGHSGLVLTLSIQLPSLFSPCLMVVDTSIWATSLIGVVLRCVFSVCLFLLVMLPSEIPKFPTDLPVRGFPAVWKLLLHDSLPRVGLHP